MPLDLVELPSELYRCEETMKMSMLARAVGGCVALHSAQGFVAGSAIGRVSFCDREEPWVFVAGALTDESTDHRSTAR